VSEPRWRRCFSRIIRRSPGLASSFRFEMGGGTCANGMPPILKMAQARAFETVTPGALTCRGHADGRGLSSPRLRSDIESAKRNARVNQMILASGGFSFFPAETPSTGGFHRPQRPIPWPTPAGRPAGPAPRPPTCLSYATEKNGAEGAAADQHKVLLAHRPARRDRDDLTF